MSDYNQKRKALLDAYFSIGQGNNCAYCGLGLRREWASLDHDPPVSQRNTKRRYDGMNAAILCCRSCNSQKGKRSAAEFRAWMATPDGRRWKNRLFCSGCARRWGPPVWHGSRMLVCPRCSGVLPAGPVALATLDSYRTAIAGASPRIDAARAVAALAGKSPVEVLVAGAEEAGRAATEIEGASRVACEDGKREG